MDARYQKFDSPKIDRVGQSGLEKVICVEPEIVAWSQDHRFARVMRSGGSTVGSL